MSLPARQAADRSPARRAEFLPAILQLQEEAPSPLPRMVLWMVVALGFFHSLMFPTIFALSLETLGRHTKFGASLLVMSIVGGAIIPAAMGWISDRSSIQTAFVLPLICYVYVLYFGARGYRPSFRTAARPGGV